MNELYLLLLSAASLGFIHTIMGPDHYLPFIVLSKARQWSTGKTMWITLLSGIGHVGSSILIGTIGIALGISLNRLEFIEAFRGEIVAWMLFTFGIAYTLYGIYKYFKSSHHAHFPRFLMPKRIREIHHLPVDEKKEDDARLTPWLLFLIFVFGPCEVLIPLLLFPAYEHQVASMFMVSLIFGLVTISTMMILVYLGNKGATFIRFKNQERYVHLFAGLVILMSGTGMLFLGW
ncbi:MAG: sulfite exporter TauE/SafE family protein [Prolixibacteraceae bacterium]